MEKNEITLSNERDDETELFTYFCLKMLLKKKNSGVAVKKLFLRAQLASTEKIFLLTGPQSLHF